MIRTIGAGRVIMRIASFLESWKLSWLPMRFKKRRANDG